MRESISAESLKALVADGAAHDLRVMRGPDGRGWQLKVRYSSVGSALPTAL